MADMITRSIYIDRELWQKTSKAANKYSVSVVISELLEKWIDGEIKLVIEPFNEEENKN